MCQLEISSAGERLERDLISRANDLSRTNQITSYVEIFRMIRMTNHVMHGDFSYDGE